VQDLPILFLKKMLFVSQIFLQFFKGRIRRIQNVFRSVIGGRAGLSRYWVVMLEHLRGIERVLLLLLLIGRLLLILVLLVHLLQTWSAMV